MIDGIFQYGSMQSLERVIGFTNQRHQVLTDNIANLSTPRFHPRELDVGQFQDELGQAIDQRRDDGDPLRGELEADPPGHRSSKDPGNAIDTRPANRNILFHDRNNRDLERLMQDLAETTLTHRIGIKLLKSQFDLLQTAIRERV